MDNGCLYNIIHSDFPYGPSARSSLPTSTSNPMVGRPVSNGTTSPILSTRPMTGKTVEPKNCEEIGVSAHISAGHIKTNSGELMKTTGKQYSEVFSGSQSGSGQLMTRGWALIFSVVHDVAKAISFLHSNQIILKYFSSTNVFLSSSGTAKVRDFGSFTPRGERVHPPHKGWVAPEVLVHEEYSEKSDVYSFGLMLWEIVSRKPELEWQDVNGARCLIVPSLTPDLFAEMILFCSSSSSKIRPYSEEIVIQLEN